MRIFNRAAAGLLCIGMILSLCACEENGSSIPTSAPVAGTTAVTTTTTVDDDIENPVDIGDVNTTIDFNAIELDDPILTYLGNYDITTAGDIKPAWKFYEKTYAQKYYNAELDDYVYPDDGTKPIVYISVAYDALLDTLAAKISSDDSPDLVDKQANTYPYWMSRNMYEDLTPYMDMSAPQWEGLQQYIDRYEYNDKHYYYPWSYDVSPEMLLYNRTLFEEYGIADPATQWQNGEWTWDAFLTAVQTFIQKSPEERVLGVYGAYLTDNFIASTGTMLIGINEDGKFENNMKTESVVRAVNFLEEELRRTGYARVDYYGEYNNVSCVPLVQGLAAFHSMGGWVFDNYCRSFADADIFLVPFPRDPQADEHYYRTSTFGYLVPKGSKNVEAACCFINCCRLSVVDPELAATTKTSIMKNKKRSEEEYDFLYQFKFVENFNTILDENYCFDTDTSTMLQNMLTNIAMDQSEEQQSWTQMIESNSPIFDAELDEFNAMIE